MQIHKPIFIAIEKALVSIFVEGRHAEKVVDYYLKGERKWGSRDRRQFAELVYDIVRWRRFLEFSGGVRREDGALNVASDISLLVGAYFENLEGFDQRRLVADAGFAVRESYSDFMYDTFSEQLGSNAEAVLKSLNRKSKIYLRANRLKVSASAVQKVLAGEGIVADIVARGAGSGAGDGVTGNFDCLVLRERKNVFQTAAYKNGFFEMQDLSSQQVAALFDVKPGMRVIDACAGAGGKSLHLASFMANKGKILSLDIHQWKLDELKKRAKRGGVDIIETRLIEGTKTVKRMEASADCLLLDVPCSGVGVLRRKPDTKWKFSAAGLAEMVSLQREILGSWARVLKPGGVLVYATCSVLPSENRDQVSWFLQENPDFVLEKMLEIYPDDMDSDGFFAAKMRLKNSSGEVVSVT